jgi:predicted nucleic acid-binding protein
VTTWLIDKSALVRLAESPDAAEWAARIERGLVRITTVTRLETGYSARSGPEMRAGFQRPPLSSMPVEYLTPAIEDRAVELLTLLADRGQHRAPSIPDLIIAATAELAGLTVLHLDKDFDLIAEITAQPMERLNMGSAAETGNDSEQAEEKLQSLPPTRLLTRTAGEVFIPEGRGTSTRTGWAGRIPGTAPRTGSPSDWSGRPGCRRAGGLTPSRA